MKDVQLQTARGNSLYAQQEKQASANNRQIQLQGISPASSVTRTASGTLAEAGANAGSTLNLGTAGSAGGRTIPDGISNATAATAPEAAAPAQPLVLSGGISIGTPAGNSKLQMREQPQTAGGTSSVSPGNALPSQASDAANPSANAEAGRFQPTGRISLAVEFPTEGEVYHFKKVKASARLDLTVTDPGVFVRWQNLAIFLVLGGALYGLGRLFERRSAARKPRPAPAH